MIDNRDPVAEFLSRLEPPEPPAALRGSALTQATQAWSQPATPDRWCQIWESRPLRLAWAAVVVGLVAAHLSLPAQSDRKPGTVSGAEHAALAGSDRELREVVTLPRLREAYVATEATGPVQAPSWVDTSEPDKEKAT
jgi:hypothetical protein